MSVIKHSTKFDMKFKQYATHEISKTFDQPLTSVNACSQQANKWMQAMVVYINHQYNPGWAPMCRDPMLMDKLSVHVKPQGLGPRILTTNTIESSDYV